MKNRKPTIGFVGGEPTEAAKRLCGELARQGISTMVKVKNETPAISDNEPIRQWSGKPGQDLFFNGWKLLF